MESQFTQSTEDESVVCCLVYDKRSGEVVHIHQFVGQLTGKAFNNESRQKMALESASKICDVKYLDTVLPSEGFDLQPNMDYRVDVKTKELVAKEISFDLTSRMKRSEKK